MTLPLSFTSILITITYTLLLIITLPLFLHTMVNALGSASTTAVVSGTATICGIVAGVPTQSIRCYQNDNNQTISVRPNFSFESISGGSTFFCGLRSGGLSILCWDTTVDITDSGFQPRRVYNSASARMTDLAVGDDQICARDVNTSIARCWRGAIGRSLFPSPGSDFKFSSITCGAGFSCGILENGSRVLCWGINPVGDEIQKQFGNLTMSTLVAGVSHACGLTIGGESLVCKGKDKSSQLSIPCSPPLGFSGIASGANFSCAIQGGNGHVICWGGGPSGFEVGNVSFETIVAGSNFACGLISWNLTLICWGPGWSNGSNLESDIPVGIIIPGPCLRSQCSTCGTYPNSDYLCHGSGNICRSCQVELPIALPLPPLTLPSSPQNLQPVSPLNRLSLPFIIVGCLGALTGICTIIYCYWVGVCSKNCLKKSDRSRQVTAPMEAGLDSVEGDGSNLHEWVSGSVSIKGQRAISKKNETSGSLSKQMVNIEMLPLSELCASTKNFSPENRIGSGSFGTVYRGLLANGQEVAIKRGETRPIMKKYKEKEGAFSSELALLSRLNHKHLVRLIGFCQEGDERLLVYEYMSNGTLHNHLHNKERIESSGGSSSSSSISLNSWKMRIKIALDAARGIEYLHNYAVPPIIHRDIKSSNILLDAYWTGRISDFGLSLIWPESDQDYISSEAVGTVGYIDPEYYVMNALTTKSDVYSFGVVLLELLTGKRAVFKDEDGLGPQGLVEYAVSQILAGDLPMVLDRRVKPPVMDEADAIEAVASMAMRCVKLEGRERPNMTDVIIDLESALSLCEDKHPVHSF